MLQLLEQKEIVSLEDFGKNLKNVSLAIVGRDSIGSSGSGTINIKRHVFLLSARELCYDVENEGTICIYHEGMLT